MAFTWKFQRNMVGISGFGPFMVAILNSCWF